MISLYLECTPAEADGLITELHERGTLGILELSCGLRAWFHDGSDVADLVARYRGEILAEEEDDWVRRTQDSFAPVEAGQRFWVVPPWNDSDPPPGRIRLEINPGLACGTGWHPCTRMCLEAMERHVDRGSRVLDVGTGSGILSVAARLLGAERAIGCDIDREAAAIASERAGAGMFIGSADAVAAEAFDVVVANISAPAIESLWPDLQRVCRDSGVMILSGFQTEPELSGVLERREEDGWLCLILRRPATGVTPAQA